MFNNDHIPAHCAPHCDTPLSLPIVPPPPPNGLDQLTRQGTYYGPLLILLICITYRIQLNKINIEINSEHSYVTSLYLYFLSIKLFLTVIQCTCTCTSTLSVILSFMIFFVSRTSIALFFNC